jgi:hypothetical protein
MQLGKPAASALIQILILMYSPRVHIVAGVFNHSLCSLCDTLSTALGYGGTLCCEILTLRFCHPVELHCNGLHYIIATLLCVISHICKDRFCRLMVCADCNMFCATMQ